MAVISMRQLLADGLPEAAAIISRCASSILSTDDQHEVLFRIVNTAGAPVSCRPRGCCVWPTMTIRSTSAQRGFLQATTILRSPLWSCWRLLSLLLSALLYVLVSQRQRALRHGRAGYPGTARTGNRNCVAPMASCGVLNAATRVAIIATDLRGVISTFNAGAEQMLGYSSRRSGRPHDPGKPAPARELAARSAELSARYGKPVPTCHAMLVEGGEEGGHEAREWTLVRGDGSHLIVNMLATPVLDEQGLWVGHLAICIDITERKRVHEALAARDLLLKKLSAHVPGGIYQFKMEFDGRFSVIYASDGIREIYELEPDVLLLNAEAIFTRIHPSGHHPRAHLDPRLGQHPQPLARGVPRATAPARPALGPRARRPRRNCPAAACSGVATFPTLPTPSEWKKNCGRCRSPTP